MLACSQAGLTCIWPGPASQPRSLAKPRIAERQFRLRFAVFNTAQPKIRCIILPPPLDSMPGPPAGHWLEQKALGWRPVVKRQPFPSGPSVKWAPVPQALLHAFPVRFVYNFG
jgi:hypothetical protein